MPSNLAEISILTPVWNGLPYIKECVDSVMSQSFQDWELIISDNGSTDGTREYLDSLIDPRIKIFKQEKNLGISGNLNFLISEATSSHAYILCADDYFLPGALQNVISEWRNAPSETAFIGFNWKQVLNHDVLGRFSYDILPKKLNPEYGKLAFFLFGNLPGNLSNVSANVELLRNAGGFSLNYRFACDFEIWAKLARINVMILSDSETAFVRRHPGAASNYLNKQGQLFAEHITIYETLINELPVRDRTELIKYFNIQVCSFHLRESLRAVVYGRLANIKMYISIKSVIFWPTWKRLLVCLPFALYETGRERVLIKMARHMINSDNKILK